jgi:hypothetical protein
MVSNDFGCLIVTDRCRGFSICRALAQRHSDHCLAVHTANPTFVEPTVKRGVMAAVKYKIAKLTQGKLPLLNFGYVPSELRSDQGDEASSTTQSSASMDESLGPTLHRLYSLRPQTLSFSLCDSPVGLLAALLDVIHTRMPTGSPLNSRSRSPFLSPVELEMQDAQSSPRHERIHSGSTERPHPTSPRQSEMENKNYIWTPTEILNWTMMQWLPGPESSLRWLRQAHVDTTKPRWNDYCAVPLGISSFQAGKGRTATPLMWGSTWWQIGWVCTTRAHGRGKRHANAVPLDADEATPTRGLASRVGSSGSAGARSTRVLRNISVARQASQPSCYSRCSVSGDGGDNKCGWLL